MATLTAVRAKSGTLTPNVVTAVALTESHPGVGVINRTQTGTIWARADGTDPTIGGDDSFPVLGARWFPTRIGGSGPTSIEVRMISSQALDFTVEGSTL